MSHLEIMSNPSFWPTWPRLPIKNSRGRLPGNFPRLGVLVSTTLEDPANDILFAEGNMFQLKPEQLTTAQKADCAQLVADGWVVD
jgi:hypothetical protein